MEVFHGAFNFFLNGKRLAYTEKLRLYLLDQELREGRRRFDLPRNSPKIFVEHVLARGGEVAHFSLNSTLREERLPRARAARDRWLFDNAHLAACLLSRFSELGETGLARELKNTPEVYITTLRYEPPEENKAKLLAMAEELIKEGKKVRLESGFYAMKIISEASSFEAALEHAFEFRGKINEIEEKIGRG
mgnify:CR=1 FL=1